MTREKALTRVRACHEATGIGFDGYEIHIGMTHGSDCARPFAHVGGSPDGAVSADGRVAGTYLHGLFTDDGFRSAWLAGRGVPASDVAFGARVDRVLDDLAAHLEASLDLDALLASAEEVNA